MQRKGRFRLACARLWVWGVPFGLAAMLIAGCGQPAPQELKLKMGTPSEPLDRLAGRWALKKGNNERRFEREFKEKGQEPLVAYLDITKDGKIEQLYSGGGRFRLQFGTAELVKGILTLRGTDVLGPEGQSDWAQNEMQFRVNGTSDVISSVAEFEPDEKAQGTGPRVIFVKLGSPAAEAEAGNLAATEPMPRNAAEMREKFLSGQPIPKANAAGTTDTSAQAPPASKAKGGATKSK